MSDRRAPIIAVFITPHGYGHAARASAVMEALRRRLPGCRFEIFTETAPWFFTDSIGSGFGYHPCPCDVGMAQRDSLHEDLPATVARLERFLPYPEAWIAELASQVTALGCSMVLCDISPLGIPVAAAAGLPSVLVENFTWDWIYSGYVDRCPELGRFIELFHDLFARATFHIQAEPVCRPLSALSAGHMVAPVARAARSSAQAVRVALGIGDGRKLVTVSMGGIAWRYRHLDRIEALADVDFLVLGEVESDGPLPPNLHLLPHRSSFYHPDLVRASDAVISKIGYSILAEIYHAGVPYGYIPRPAFPESRQLASFIETRMASLAIDTEDFLNGEWIGAVPSLLALPTGANRVVNGADQIAELLSGRIA